MSMSNVQCRNMCDVGMSGTSIVKLLSILVKSSCGYLQCQMLTSTVNVMSKRRRLDVAVEIAMSKAGVLMWISNVKYQNICHVGMSWSSIVKLLLIFLVQLRVLVSSLRW